jgi:DNA-binding transcriptional regulator YdaS (Cro superfamily)
MKLIDWLESNSVTIPAFAQMLGEGVETVRHWVKGRRVPRPDRMVKIVMVTRGEVTANDFFTHVSSSESTRRSAISESV